MNTTTLIAFSLYLLGLFAIAFAAYKRTADATDYALGGRSLGPAVAALSAGASDMSGWLLLGLPGAVYASGLVEGWIVVGLVLGAFANWRLVAARLRRQSGDGVGEAGQTGTNARTLPAFFAARLTQLDGGADARTIVLLRSTATLLILFFFTFYVASGLVAGARLFEATLGLDYLVALVAGAIVIVAYTVAGGFLAVAWTDFFQGLLMLAALVLVPALAFGSAPADAAATASAPSLDVFQGLTLLSWLSLVAWGLGYFGQPHVLARFMAISSADEVPRATTIAMGWMLVVSAGALAVGIAGQQALPTVLENPEAVFIELTALLLHPLVAGMVLAAILAAVMSTIDSQLLVASTSLAEDVWAPLRGSDPDGRELVAVGRAAVVLVAALAFVLALDPDARVLSLVSYAWAGLGASFGPLVLAVLYTRALSARGALASMIVGGSTVVVWGALEGGLFDLYEIVPGFAAASAVLALSARR